MNPQLTKRILRRYPRIYRAYYRPMTQTCMCWGFEHGDGWFDIIWRVSRDITREWRRLPKDQRNEFEVSQVKAKFGTLSYYVHGGNKQIFDLTMRAQAESARTCELCGAPGKHIAIMGWYWTICRRCEHWRYINRLGDLPHQH